MIDGRTAAVRRLLAGASDLVWPVLCAGCGVPQARWCASCAGLLAGPALPTAPTPCPAGLPPAWATGRYAGPVRRAIVSWKDEERHDLTRPFAVALALAVGAALAATKPGAAGPADGPDVLLVPVPSRRAARRARGGNPLLEMAVRAAGLLREPSRRIQVVPALEHRRGVLDQAGLGAEARALNLAGALRVRRGACGRVVGRSCLLVDDIITTGSTLTAAAEALREVGAHPFGVAVLAATARERGSG